MMQISVDQIRELCSTIYVSLKVCERKFVVIHDAGRMHNATANALLKTLEEPPDDIIISFTASRVYAMLPTIIADVRSPGCLPTANFWRTKKCRFGWRTILHGYHHCSTQAVEKTNAIMQMYLLLAQLEALWEKYQGFKKSYCLTYF
jgi:hypothetical protein